MTDDQPLRGELYDELVRAMQKVPELAGRLVDAERPLRGHHEPQFPGGSASTTDRWAIRLAGNDTHLLGISRGVEHAATVAAAGVGVGPEVTAFIRPEGYLVTRFIVGSPGPMRRCGIPRRFDAWRTHCAASTMDRRSPGCSYHFASASRTGPRAGAGRPIPRLRRRRRDRTPIERAFLADPLELRPSHNDLLNANFIDHGSRIRIIDWEYAGMGDPFFDLGNFSINHELNRGRRTAILLEAYDGEVARLRGSPSDPMGVVSDFREAMWGVLQQGVSSLDVDFVDYATSRFRRRRDNATEPRFEAAIRLISRLNRT